MCSVWIKGDWCVGAIVLGFCFVSCWRGVLGGGRARSYTPAAPAPRRGIRCDDLCRYRSLYRICAGWGLVFALGIALVGIHRVRQAEEES